jgi:hypothetical protein
MHARKLLGLVWWKIGRERAVLYASPAKKLASGTRRTRWIGLPFTSAHERGSWIQWAARHDLRNLVIALPLGVDLSSRCFYAEYGQFLRENLRTSLTLFVQASIEDISSPQESTWKKLSKDCEVNSRHRADQAATRVWIMHVMVACAIIPFHTSQVPDQPRRFISPFAYLMKLCSRLISDRETSCLDLSSRQEIQKPTLVISWRTSQRKDSSRKNANSWRES